MTTTNDLYCTAITHLRLEAYNGGRGNIRWRVSIYSVPDAIRWPNQKTSIPKHKLVVSRKTKLKVVVSRGIFISNGHLSYSCSHDRNAASM